MGESRSDPIASIEKKSISMMTKQNGEKRVDNESHTQNVLTHHTS